jgi:hypothetical protein
LVIEELGTSGGIMWLAFSYLVFLHCNLGIFWEWVSLPVFVGSS